MKQDDDPPMLKYEMLAPKVDFTPEQRLWLAVVVRAIVDYGLISTTARQQNESTYSIHLKAACFLFARKDQDKPASLGWIAEHITDQPVAFVRCVKSLARRLYNGQQERLKCRHRVRHARLSAMVTDYAA